MSISADSLLNTNVCCSGLAQERLAKKGEFELVVISLCLSQEDGIKEVSVVSRCLSTTEPYWLSVLFGYKAIIQAIGLYLAFKIRNIKIRGLNDSREVSITLYVSSVILLIIVIVTFVYGDYIDVDGFVYGFGLSTAATVVLSLTFIPKVCGSCLLWL